MRYALVKLSKTLFFVNHNGRRHVLQRPGKTYAPAKEPIFYHQKLLIGKIKRLKISTSQICSYDHYLLTSTTKHPCSTLSIASIVLYPSHLSTMVTWVHVYKRIRMADIDECIFCFGVVRHDISKLRSHHVSSSAWDSSKCNHYYHRKDVTMSLHSEFRKLSTGEEAAELKSLINYELPAGWEKALPYHEESSESGSCEMKEKRRAEQLPWEASG
ncbi:hypothetical protein RIF29_19343 [Crotalaria pallida]|uniref:Uncharacterized protein n=1 Tax=Crotalaria pallida TaxID=3830 RepID=A0AAN9I424_CROPI